MEILEWIRFLAGVGMLLIGMGIFALQLFGVFKFKYVLNRMHAAAMGDTLGIGVSLTGLIILSGFNAEAIKLAVMDEKFDEAKAIVKSLTDKYPIYK